MGPSARDRGARMVQAAARGADAAGMGPYLPKLARAIEGLDVYRDYPDLRGEFYASFGAEKHSVEELYGTERPAQALDWLQKELESGNEHRGLRPVRTQLLLEFPELADEEDEEPDPLHCPDPKCGYKGQGKPSPLGQGRDCPSCGRELVPGPKVPPLPGPFHPNDEN